MNLPLRDPTKRFSTRVENYNRYRPGYPDAVIPMLESEVGLSPASIIADIGSGTGISTELFLRHGNRVFAVEPNVEMRNAAESRLKSYPGFSSVAGTAERTTLDRHSVDFVVAGQAFHWFDAHQSKMEFVRILKPTGYVILMWNTRRRDATPFLEEYELLIETYATDYRQVNHTNVNDLVLREFFASGGHTRRELYNEQVLDYAGLKGRLLSSSYMPDEHDAGFRPVHAKLRDIFERHNVNGRVRLEYTTEIYYGRIAPS